MQARVLEKRVACRQSAQGEDLIEAERRVPCRAVNSGAALATCLYLSRCVDTPYKSHTQVAREL